MVRLAEAALKCIVLAVSDLILGNAEVKPNFYSEINILIEQSNILSQLIPVMFSANLPGKSKPKSHDHQCEACCACRACGRIDTKALRSRL